MNAPVSSASMRLAIAFLLFTSSLTGQQIAPSPPDLRLQPRYLSTIQQRWDVSDLVCTAVVASPRRTGVIRRFDRRDRDQLSAEVTIERCFKGTKPQMPTVTLLGYSFYATRDVRSGAIAYSGAPVGFVSKGRNLVFLRRTDKPDQFDIAVPIYRTAIRLADRRPYYPNNISSAGVRFALIREFEAALVQFDSMDIVYLEHIFDLLGTREAIVELRGFAPRAPVAIQRDIAVSLLSNGEMDSEPVVISLLQDASAPAWKRGNAAHALGEHGTKTALPYLRQVVAEPASTDDLRSLRLQALDGLQRLETRLSK